MAEYLEGFLDEVTIQALRQAGDCTNSRIGGYPITQKSHPLTGTMWYHGLTGTIHNFGNGKPKDLSGNEQIIPATVLYDETASLPLPKLYHPDEMTPALETALASIEAFLEVEEPLANIFN